MFMENKNQTGLEILKQKQKVNHNIYMPFGHVKPDKQAKQLGFIDNGQVVLTIKQF